MRKPVIIHNVDEGGSSLSALNNSEDQEEGDESKSCKTVLVDDFHANFDNYDMLS